MIIKEIKIYSKTHFIKTNLLTASYNHANRDSWIIEITNSNHITGYGEASPVPNFNNETYEQVGYSLEGFKLALKDIKEIDVEEIFIMAKVHSFEVPSACFAIETAIYDILAKESKLPLNLYLNDNAHSKILVNGIYMLSDYKKYNIMKVKCGFRNLYDEIELLETLTEKYGESMKFILDLNESYDLPKAIRFSRKLLDLILNILNSQLSKII